MNNQPESFTKPRQAVLPNHSNRVLQHPSFMPLFLETGFALRPDNDIVHHQTVPVAIPSDFFYIEPSCGSRIPNIVTELKPYECFRLNTPAPVMSTCPATPNHPDPFSAGPFPTRNLGSPTWNMNPGLSPILPWRMGPKRTVLQLTLEEDLAINSLLKLYHGDLRHQQHSGTLTVIDPQTEHFSGGGSSVEIKRLHTDGPYLQAVHLSLLKEDGTWNLEVRNPDHHSFLQQEVSKRFTGSPSASECDEISPSLIAGRGDRSDCTQMCATPVLEERMNALGIYSRLVEGQVGWDRGGDALTSSCDEEHLSASPPVSSPPLSLCSEFSEESRPGVFWELPGVSEGTMLESECVAVNVLLGLGEHGTL